MRTSGLVAAAVCSGVLVASPAAAVPGGPALDDRLTVAEARAVYRDALCPVVTATGRLNRVADVELPEDVPYGTLISDRLRRAYAAAWRADRRAGRVLARVDAWPAAVRQRDVATVIVVVRDDARVERIRATRGRYVGPGYRTTGRGATQRVRDALGMSDTWYMRCP